MRRLKQLVGAPSPGGQQAEYLTKPYRGQTPPEGGGDCQGRPSPPRGAQFSGPGTEMATSGAQLFRKKHEKTFRCKAHLTEATGAPVTTMAANNTGLVHMCTSDLHSILRPAITISAELAKHKQLSNKTNCR